MGVFLLDNISYSARVRVGVYGNRNPIYNPITMQRKHSVRAFLRHKITHFRFRHFLLQFCIRTKVFYHRLQLTYPSRVCARPVSVLVGYVFA